MPQYYKCTIVATLCKRQIEPRLGVEVALFDAYGKGDNTLGGCPSNVPQMAELPCYLGVSDFTPLEFRTSLPCFLAFLYSRLKGAVRLMVRLVSVIFIALQVGDKGFHCFE